MTVLPRIIAYPSGKSSNNGDATKRPMALDPLEWIIIGVIVVVIFLWGPTKIPALARALGRARKEYEAGKKDGGSE